MSASQINGKGWDMNVPLATMQYNVVQEWKISGTGAHLFHLHIYHMQVVMQGGCGQHKEGKWYNAILGGSGLCTVQFCTINYEGRVVVHCHVLSHEDNGAMGWVSVTGGPAAGTAFLALGTCPTSSPSLRPSTGIPSRRPSMGKPSMTCKGNN
jgi:FtsP/CotA-like multicopper oxidase with cupredoxin domain